MLQPEDVEYTVVLVSPCFGEARENAEQIIEEALDYLNTNSEEPGFRFAPYVSAHLEMVSDVEQAQEKLENDDTVAMMILHDLEDEERIAFTHECARHDVPVCRTIPAPDEPEDGPKPPAALPRRMQVVIRKRAEDDHEPNAHRILDTALTAPLEDEPEHLMNRVWQLIAVMALGVMEHHWKKNPPQWRLPPQ